MAYPCAREPALVSKEDSLVYILQRHDVKKNREGCVERWQIITRSGIHGDNEEPK